MAKQKLAPARKCHLSGESLRRRKLERLESGKYRCVCGAEVSSYKKGYGYESFIKSHNAPRETVEQAAARERVERVRTRAYRLEARYEGAEKAALQRVVAMMTARELAGISFVEFVSRQERAA